MSPVIWWVRRDLRLGDNPVLTEAAQAGNSTVIPIFILDPSLLHSSYVGQKRLSFLFEGLRRLDEDLKKIGSRLIIRRGAPQHALRQMFEETGARKIYAQSDHSPFAKKRDKKVSGELPLKLVGTPAIYPPGTVLKSDGDPYLVYTPFSRRWKSLSDLSEAEILPAPEELMTPDTIHSLKIPPNPISTGEAIFQPGERKGIRRLNEFISGDEPLIYQYRELRNRIDKPATSILSPYLRFGMISARHTAKMAVEAIKRAPSDRERQSADAWLNEIIWRDFYIHILHFFPEVRSNNFRQKAISWLNDQGTFSDWQVGRTGYPIIDAAMRQLTQTGWMHNRSRMIVASFLTKNLLIDWRWGERWFMQQLIDGDPASNNGGWQWTAGTGTDAAPYFRIFNPISQSKKHDPNGSFIRRWLPVLANIPDQFIHEPWKMPIDVQRQANCIIGKDYPEPIIDIGFSRERALEAFKSATKYNEN